VWSHRRAMLPDASTDDVGDYPPMMSLSLLAVRSEAGRVLPFGPKYRLQHLLFDAYTINAPSLVNSQLCNCSYLRDAAFATVLRRNCRRPTKQVRETSAIRKAYRTLKARL